MKLAHSKCRRPRGPPLVETVLIFATLLPVSVDAFTCPAQHVATRHRHNYYATPLQSTGNEVESNNNIETEITVVDVSSPALDTPKDTIIMSPSIPFLKCPDVLVDCTMAGNVGFDPLGFAKTEEDLIDYREAEVRHGRLAMLAAAGWPLSELLDRKIADLFGLDTLLDAYDRAPSLLNGGLERVSPVWWGTCFGLTAAIDLDAIAKSRTGNPDYFPGNLEWDPLGLYPSDEEGQAWMQLAEIKHGRLSMIAVAAFALQEWVTKLGVVDETPLFFFPINESLQRMGMI